MTGRHLDVQQFIQQRCADIQKQVEASVAEIQQATGLVIIDVSVNLVVAEDLAGQRLPVVMDVQLMTATTTLVKRQA